MNLSLYIHIPFCVHRCAYCDFNTYAGQEDSLPAYVEALCNEIDYIGASRQRQTDLNMEDEQVHTIFFGGGTPSLLNPLQFNRILQAIRRNFRLTPSVEITIEANPGTVSLEDLKKYHDAGLNRISFGVQSANSEELRMLERAHDFFDVIHGVEWARKAGFDDLNLDLIYGLPEQTLPTWQNSVKAILALRPQHISAYALTLEHGTPFGRWSKRGLLPVPDPDLAADMYEWASDAFEAGGYHQYEISNWSQPEHECLHNLQYWRALPYLGLGAGAHGYAAGYRYSNVLRIKTYIDRLKQEPAALEANRNHDLQPAWDYPLTPAVVNQHRQSHQEDMSDFMITGLRLTREGISRALFRQRFGRDLMETFGSEIQDLVGLGLLEWNKRTSEAGASEVLRLTQRGRLLGNKVFMRFVN